MVQETPKPVLLKRRCPNCLLVAWMEHEANGTAKCPSCDSRAGKPQENPNSWRVWPPPQPSEHLDVLATIDGEWARVLAWDEHQEAWVDHRGRPKQGMTHWMSIPPLLEGA